MADESNTDVSKLEASIAKAKEELLARDTSASETSNTETAAELAKSQVASDTMAEQFEAMKLQMAELLAKDNKVIEQVAPVETPEDALKKQLADMQEQLDAVKTRRSVPKPTEPVDKKTALEQGRAEYKSDPSQFIKNHLNELGMNLP